MSGVKRKESFTTQEVLDQIFADPDSDTAISDEEEENELIQDILEDGSRSSDEERCNDAAMNNDDLSDNDEPLYFVNKVRTRGGPNPSLHRRRGMRTRGGSSSRGVSRDEKQNQLEENNSIFIIFCILPLGSWGYKNG